MAASSMCGRRLNVEPSRPCTSRPTVADSRSCRPTVADSFDEYVSRSRINPVPYTEDVHQRRTRAYMTDDQRFASRRPDVDGLPSRSIAHGARDTRPAPIVADLFVSHHRHGRRLRGKADRRVPGLDLEDYPDNDRDVPMAGYQMLVRGLRFCGDATGTASRIRSRSCRPRSRKLEFDIPAVAAHVQTGAPDHDPGAELLVPAGGPKPADVREHLRGGRGGLPRKRRTGSITTRPGRPP